MDIEQQRALLAHLKEKTEPLTFQEIQAMDDLSSQISIAERTANQSSTTPEE